MRPFGVCARTDSLLLFPVGSNVLDLSKATKLQDMTFRSTSLGIGWITAAIQTTRPKHRELRKISILVPRSLTHFNVDKMKKSAIYREWLDLDRLLVQLWGSHSTPLRVICTTWNGQPGGLIGFTNCMLPELTKTGAVAYVDNL